MKKERLELVEEFLSAKNNKVFDVLGLMESLEMYFKKGHRELTPFLKTYSIVTRSVIDKQVSGNYFEDVGSLENLDIYFASLYFSPLKKYLMKGTKRKPWKTYLEYSSRKKRIEFLNMLLGINAHINGDLPETLYKNNYKIKKDFLKINDILKEDLPQVMWYLATRRFDFMGLAGVLFGGFFVEEFRKTVCRWREDAWNNYKKINSKNHEEKIKEIHEKTEKAAKELIEIFDDLYSISNLKSVLKRLENVRVRV